MPDSPGPEFPDGPEFPEFTEDELTSVMFDEEFVRAARIREPSAAERAVPRVGRGPDDAVPGREAPGDHLLDDVDPYAVVDPRGPGDGFPDDGPRLATAGSPDGVDGPWRRRSRPGRWRKAVAWILALVMGVGVVAVALSAVFRSGTSSGPQPSHSPQPAAGSGPAPSSSPGLGPAPVGPVLTGVLSATPLSGR